MPICILNDYFLAVYIGIWENLTSYLGIDPINNFNESTPVFCIRDGKFVAEGEVAEQHFLFSKEESVVMHALLSDEMLNISRIKRNNVLDALIRYYQYHVPGFHACKTAEVLHQVFESWLLKRINDIPYWLYIRADKQIDVHKQRI